MTEDRFELDLRQSLYRFDCPDAHTLGEYAFDLLEPAERTRIAAHAVECEACASELEVLRSFVAAPTSVGETLARRARRFVATLLTPGPDLAYGGLRGAADMATRVYEAGNVSVTLGPGLTSGSLLGLAVALDDAPAALEAAAVRLLPREGPPTVTHLDDLGNFEFANLEAGVYTLEIELPDGVVVISDLPVD